MTARASISAHAAISALERELLGLTTPPWPQRAHAARWAPDAPEAYCPRCGATRDLDDAAVAQALAAANEGDAPPAGCAGCETLRPAWARAVRLGVYDGLLRDAIHDIKFTAFRRLGRDVGRTLGDSLRLALLAAGHDPARAVVAPLPSSFWRRLDRGIDHATELARGVAETSGAELRSLFRRRHRPSQVGIPAGDRRKNVAGAFRAVNLTDLAGRPVVLVDDIKTTGSTMREATRTLQQAWRESHPGAPAVEVWATWVAVTPPAEPTPPPPPGGYGA